jgi:hypothetical protein
VLSFEGTVSAVTYSIIQERCSDHGERERFAHNRVVRFVLAQAAAMPDHLHLPFHCLVLVLDAWPVAVTGRPFHRLPHDQRWRVIERWRRSRLGFRRDLVRFFESLVIFAWFGDNHEPRREGRASAA